MKRIEIAQRTPEWIEFRKNRISATDAAPIMGISPYKSPLMLWEEKIFGRKGDSNLAMERGISLEKKALEWTQNMLGHQLTDAFVQSDTFDWAIASLDGISEDGKILVEIKCPGNKVHQQHLAANIADYYHCQMQHQMMVTDCDICHFVSFDGEDGVVIIVPRDEEFIKDMLLEEFRFLHLLHMQIPPEASHMDFVSRMDSTWDDACKRWKEAKAKLKEAEILEEELKQNLIDLSRSTNSIGCGVKLQKITRKGNIDYASIKELRHVDLEKYRKPLSEFWKLSEV